MWIQIEKPKINFHFFVSQNEKFYYNEKTNEYINEDWSGKYYFNLNGKLHRLDGPVRINGTSFWIDGIAFSTVNFAEKTNHLVCKKCQMYCNQWCF